MAVDADFCPGELLRIAAGALRKENARLANWRPKRGLDRLFETTLTYTICSALNDEGYGRAFDWELGYGTKRGSLDLGIFDIPAGQDIPKGAKPSYAVEVKVHYGRTNKGNVKEIWEDVFKLLRLKEVRRCFVLLLSFVYDRDNVDLAARVDKLISDGPPVGVARPPVFDKAEVLPWPRDAMPFPTYFTYYEENEWGQALVSLVEVHRRS